MVSISKRIRLLRIRNKYTQEQLAVLCGVSRQAVAKWESGTNTPDLDKSIKLSQVFHISVDELVTGRKPASYPAMVDEQRTDQVDKEKIVNEALRRAMACEEPEGDINQFITYIGRQIGFDRVYIFELNTDEDSYKNTYEWCNKGIPSQMEYLQSVPKKDLSVWLTAFSKGEHILIADLDDIADSEPDIYRWLRPRYIDSLLVYPLFGGRGFLGVDNPAPAFISQTSSLIEIMIHFLETMLQRRELTRKLERTVIQNDQYSRISKGISYQLNVVTGKLEYDQDRSKELGYSIRIRDRAELEAMALSHPEFHDHLMLDGIEKVIEAKENLSIEFISFKDDGHIRWNRLSISPFIDSDGQVLQLYGVLQDVSREHHVVEQYNKYASRLSGGVHICYLSRPVHLEYASDGFCNFLGYSRDEFERITGGKYTNVILDEDRAVFEGYVKRLSTAPGVESCEYRVRKKDGSLVSVVDTMESFMDSNGIMHGYAYIIEKLQLHVLLSLAEEDRAKQLTLINRQYEVLKSLCRDYLNIFRVWLDEDKAQIVSLNGYVTKGMDRKSAEFIPYYRLCRQYIQDRVHPEDRNKMTEAMHPDNVRKALTAENEYIVVYRAIDQGMPHFYQLKYVRLEDEEDGTRINFVAGFKNIDRVIEEEHAQKEKLQSRMNIINAILRVFTCGYYIDYKKDRFSELSNVDENIRETIGVSGRFKETCQGLKETFPDKWAVKNILDFLDHDSLGHRLAGQKYLSSQVFVKGFGWFEMYLFVVEYSSDGSVTNCIFAARDISEEKEKQEEYMRSLDIVSNREKAALRIAYTDALTSTMNRNAFERDFRKLDNYENVGFIFCDVNGLKRTNDTAGHSSGDQLLVDFSQLMRKCFSVDCIYRIGGDEFVCMIGGIGREGFMGRTDKFRDLVREKGNIASVGRAYGPSEDRDKLLKEAENEMYAMKSGGR